MFARLPDEEQTAVRDAFRAIPMGFGRPHLHAGLGLRQLRPGVYEARVGLKLRALFGREGNLLVVHLLGNHDEVRRYLRSR